MWYSNELWEGISFVSPSGVVETVVAYDTGLPYDPWMIYAADTINLPGQSG
jgi:hypothetical protein